MKSETHECNEKSLVKQEGDYHYLESSLPNVYLRNVKWYKCKECQRTEAVIPKIGQLHRCIAWRIIQKPTLLKGLEVRFLRKMMRAEQSSFAGLLGINRNELSSLENNVHTRRKRTKATDTAIRILYLAFKDDEYTEEAHKIVKKELHKFELLRKAALRSDDDAIVIDPGHCGKEQEVQKLLEG